MPGEPDFQLLFGESPDILLVLLPDAPKFRTVAGTQARWRATHTSPDTLGQGLFEIFPDNPDDPAATGMNNLRASLGRVLQTRRPDTMPVQKYDIRDPDGRFEARYWSPKNIPVLSAAGEVRYILHRVEDVTDLVRAGEAGQELRDRTSAMEREVIKRSQELEVALRELRQMNVKLSERDIAKTTFFSNISHEFRTPLTLMLGPLEDELGERLAPLPPDRRSRLGIAQRTGLRLLRLVNNLLDFSRIEAGRAQAQYQLTNLSALTIDLASHFHTAMERAKLTLRVECPPLPELMYVDREMWEKVVINLLSNAFKHTFEGAVTVRLAWSGDGAQLTVEDMGIGISADHLARIFERFHRVEGARSRTHEGTGIGLSLVRELVQLHGGEIRAESEPGLGSRFIVTLKSGSAHLPTDKISQLTDDNTKRSVSDGSTPAIAQEALSWLSEAPSALVTTSAARTSTPAASESAVPRARILWAEDNADMRQYVMRLLNRHYDVIAVPDGQAALESAHASLPDLVLSDVMMPRLDGLGLLKALRDHEHLRPPHNSAIGARRRGVSARKPRCRS